MEKFDLSTPEKFETFLRENPEFDTPRQRRILDSRKRTESFLQNIRTESVWIETQMQGDRGAAVRALMNDQQDEALRILLKGKSLEEIAGLLNK